MSKQATIAFYECENAIGHATAHLTRDERIECYASLVASWQQELKDLAENRRCPHGYERDDLESGAAVCEPCSSGS